MSQLLDDVPSDEAAATLKAAASTGSGSGDREEEDQISSYLAANNDNDDGNNQQITAPSPSIVSPWEQFNKSMQREIFSAERPSWREEWFGVHLPPSAVARGGRPTVDDSIVGHDAAILLLIEDEHDLEAPNFEVEEEDDEEDDEEEVQHPSKPSPTEHTIQASPPAIISSTPPSLSTLLLQLASSEGPSIPLYPLLIVLTTLYLIKKVLQCLFSYKSRTHVKRSMNKVVFWKRHNQFTISQRELVRHLDWMKRRSDLRREREKQKKKKKKNVDKKESTKDRNDFDNAGGSSDGGDGGGQQSHH